MRVWNVGAVALEGMPSIRDVRREVVCVPKVPYHSYAP